ncbi:MAG: HAD hydrolase family protein [Bacteroidales bacterium]|nr:HAD hydrolase family protein [Bacteroidales bacterium]
MSFFKDDIREVRAFLFDVDGVLSEDVSPLDGEGDPVRTANVKDGYALRRALAAGYAVGIITGGVQRGVRMRYAKLGIRHFYDNASEKTGCLEDFIRVSGVDSRQILYMGDDLPDYPVMTRVGIPTCPADAVPEIKAVARYVSDRKGGRGCVRDVIEQVMRASDHWDIPAGSENQAL